MSVPVLLTDLQIRVATFLVIAGLLSGCAAGRVFSLTSTDGFHIHTRIDVDTARSESTVCVRGTVMRAVLQIKDDENPLRAQYLLGRYERLARSKLFYLQGHTESTLGNAEFAAVYFTLGLRELDALEEEVDRKVTIMDLETPSTLLLATAIARRVPMSEWGKPRDLENSLSSYISAAEQALADVLRVTASEEGTTCTSSVEFDDALSP